MEVAPAAEEIEMAERKRFIENLYLAGASIRGVISIATRELGITTVQATYALGQVRQEVMQSFEQDRASNRAAQAERLHADLARMRAQLGEYHREVELAQTEKRKPRRVPHPTWNDINRHEMALARILGTLAPIQVRVDTDVRVREALVAVMGNLDRDRWEQMIDEQRQLEERTRSIDAEGTAV